MVMEAQILLSNKNLRKYNLIRYKAVHPPQKLIEKVIKDSGLKFFSRFEIVWGIPKDVLTQVKRKKRGLPPKYWHIFYDFDIANQIYAKERKQTKKASKQQTILQTNKSVVDGLRNR